MALQRKWLNLRRAGPLVLFVAVLIGFFFLIPSASATNTAAPQSDDVDLICHPDDPGNCYPRVFQPTHEFQIVHDDQELPNGLHVRLNIWTGEKEAKINVPDENNPALEGLPIDRSVVVVDAEEAVVEPVAEQIPRGAPAYEPVGHIKKPAGDATSFYNSLSVLKKGHKGQEGLFDQSLDALEDISHDIYYGLKIAEDTQAMEALLCLMVDREGSVVSAGAVPRDQQAALILAGALQNNNAALKEVEESWKDLMAAKCTRRGQPLVRSFHQSFMPSDTISTTEIPRAVSRVKARVAAISTLIKSPKIRDEFLTYNEMSRLLEVLVPEGSEWDSAQKKVGQLVLDTFLDKDMGATVGIFPSYGESSGVVCDKNATKTDEGCWNYHVSRIMKRHEGDESHWSREVHAQLRAAYERVKDKSRESKDEL